MSSGYQDYQYVAELYDYVTPYASRPDVDFFVEAALEAGGPVLEVGCGTGRVLIPTARSGVHITGLDFSKHMLEVCRAKLQAEPPNVQKRVKLARGDMRDFDLGRTFSLVTLPFRPFQHLVSVQEQMDTLKTINRHLDLGGLLILDLFNPSLPSLIADNLGQEIGDEPPFTMPDGRIVVRTHKVVERDLFNQINYVELLYHVTHPDGHMETLVHAFPMRYLFRYEAEHLLERCGFTVMALYADYDKRPFGSKYPGELIFIAQKG